MNKEKMKKIVLLTYDNFREEIHSILLDTEIDYLIFLYFTSNMKENISLLENTKKYFFNTLKNEFMENVIIISQREYLANDMLVKAVIMPNDINNFNYFKFTLLYENTKIDSLNDFLIKNKAEFNYKLDLYETVSPWIYHKYKTNILLINKDTKKQILENYHKVKFIVPDIILIILYGESDEEIIKLLKLIGADAHITIGFINKMVVPYTKRTDAFIYVEGESFDKIGKTFIDEFIKFNVETNGVIKLRNFLKIPEKNFEVDMSYDEEREINKKEIKYYNLKISDGNSLKREIKYDYDKNKLIFNMGIKQQYILEKI